MKILLAIVKYLCCVRLEVTSSCNQNACIKVCNQQRTWQIGSGRKLRAPCGQSTSSIDTVKIILIYYTSNTICAEFFFSLQHFLVAGPCIYWSLTLLCHVGIKWEKRLSGYQHGKKESDWCSICGDGSDRLRNGDWLKAVSPLQMKYVNWVVHHLAMKLRHFALWYLVRKWPWKLTCMKLEHYFSGVY
jgi:hypothetical protein